MKRMILMAMVFGAGLAMAGEGRQEVLAGFRIQGVCGSERLEDAVQRGANTVRTYVVPSREDLDRYAALGLRVIVGNWMPHEGENTGRDGVKWSFSYESSGDKQAAEFAGHLERVGDHPAILMWGLGNEVHLDPPYLRQVERLSRMVHERFPRMPTSLTLINAPPEKVRLIVQLAPDLDVLGVNSYGAGAVANAIKSLAEHWQQPYYFSEFGPTGPWWGPQTSWGVRFEAGAGERAGDLGRAWEHMLAAPGCVGGCVFLWGMWERERITYFSALLPPDPFGTVPARGDLRFTPLADELARRWTGKPPERSAPVLQRVEINGRGREDIVLPVGATMRLLASASDTDSPAESLRFRWWVARENGGRLERLAGPVEAAGPEAKIAAPDEPGAFILMCLVLDDGDGAAGMTLPFRTE
jgi:hypothetical protein